VSAAPPSRRRQRSISTDRWREHERDHDAVLRLVDQEADQDAGKQRPAVEHHEGAAKQRGGEEIVLAMAGIDQDRREGDGEQQPITGLWKGQTGG
jgi:hypothetical protein